MMGKMKIFLPAVCILCMFLYLFNPGSRDFWAPDEGDFAEIVTELKDNLIVPHLNGTPYGEKPPLFYYITYASKKVLFFMNDEVSMRFSTAIFAIAGVLFLLLTAWKFIDPGSALLSTLILLSTPLYYWQARFLQVDMVFSVFVAGSLLSFFWFYNTGKKGFFYIFFLLTGFAFMTKGPLSAVLIFPVVLAFLFIEKNFKILNIRDILIGIAILVVTIAPWYLAIYFKEGLPYLYENVFRQNFVRFFDAWSHRRPFYYYFTTFPLDFFPWSLFLPIGIYLAVLRCRDDRRIGFFLIWSLWMFVFFSLSSGKISKYMLPLLPPVSIITSFAFAKPDSRYNTIIFYIFSMLFFLAGILLFFYRTDFYPEFFRERLFMGAASIVLSASILFLIKHRNRSYLFFALFCFLIFSYMTANISIYKKWNLYKSPKPMAERIKPYLDDGTPWVYYGSMRGIYVYYIGKYAIHVDEHDISELKRLESMKKFYILTRKRDYKELTDTLAEVRTVFEEKIGSTAMVFSLYEKNM
jgi:4-amino-4-deoxy-L-arabinose transferase-like glycosyltransferase